MASCTRPRSIRPGFTLVEMLVAMAITLIMMGAVVTLFDQMGTAVNDSRSTVEMASRLRNARNRLQMDLASHTCRTEPWAQPESGPGYFEYIEGQYRDTDPTRLSLNPATSLIPPNPIGNYDTKSGPYFLGDGPTGLGDYDDFLMFTIRSRGEPFVGSSNGVSVESLEAEVIWFAIENNPDIGMPGEPGMRTVYRRILLIAPWVADLPPPAIIATADYDTSNITLAAFHEKYGLSARVEGTSIRLNSLADLTKRENRFAHDPVTFPHPLLPQLPAPLGAAAGDRLGEDLMLTNVLAFDVRAYDPQAPILQFSPALPDVVVAPGEPGWVVASGATNVSVLGLGAYVDLNYDDGPYPTNSSPRLSLFSGPSEDDSMLGSKLPNGSSNPNAQHFRFDGPPTIPVMTNTYCTWSTHYESDGINQDNVEDALFDEGTDGFDNDNLDGVDDRGESETSPPYPSPLRGIEVRLRVYEPDSRQIREVTVRQTFVPE